MGFELSIVINRPREEAFAFFRDIDQHAGQKGTIVPVYDKITPGLSAWAHATAKWCR